VSRPAAGGALVLGLGNVLLRDEGVGVHLAQALLEAGAANEATALPAAVRVVDGGTLGLDLLPLIEDAAAVVLIDAVDLGAAPGTIEVLRGDALQGALALHVSPHQVGVGDLLGAARLAGSLPERTSLVAIQPGAIEVGLELTPEVAAAVPTAVEVVLRELAGMVAGPLAAGRGPADPEPSGAAT
jgi:hydrogenase maturation protease